LLKVFAISDYYFTILYVVFSSPGRMPWELMPWCSVWHMASCMAPPQGL